MVYLVSTMLRKAHEIINKDGAELFSSSNDDVWKQIMLTPYDFDIDAINNPTTRKLMEVIEFVHGGDEYDEKYIEMEDDLVYIGNILVAMKLYSKQVSRSMKVVFPTWKN